ncbi:MAG: cytochrome c maturation protein CcmE [Acidobacteriota bacterium]
MKPTQIKIVVLSMAIVTGIMLLAADGSRSSTVYYQTIPELMASPSGGGGTVRVTGHVVAGSIQRPAGAPLSFLMQDASGAQRLAVRYGDVVPDTFKDGAEVVVEGALSADATFEASTLLAKCPSKYEASKTARS